MQTNTINNATIPNAHLMPQGEIRTPNEASKRTPLYVFYAGDHFTLPEKREDADKAFGGIQLTEFHSLKYTNGIVYRCAITELKPRMADDNPQMYPPSERGKMPTSYIQEKGEYDALAGDWRDVRVSGVDTNPMNGRPVVRAVYVEVFPADEIRAMTAPSDDLRPGGVVELKALRGADAAEKTRHQLFYFPDWQDIQTGKKAFPDQFKTLQVHIGKRYREAVGLQDEALMQTGLDMLRSCDEFAAWGKSYVKHFTAQIKHASNNPLAHASLSVYNERSEMLMQMLGIVREDAILDELNKVAQFAPAPTADRDLQERLVKAQEEANELKRMELGAQKMVNEPAPPTDKFAVGNEVSVGERTGRIVEKKPFGKIQVEFADKTTGTFDKKEITV